MYRNYITLSAVKPESDCGPLILFDVVLINDPVALAG